MPARTNANHWRHSNTPSVSYLRATAPLTDVADVPGLVAEKRPLKLCFAEAANRDRVQSTPCGRSTSHSPHPRTVTRKSTRVSALWPRLATLAGCSCPPNDCCGYPQRDRPAMSRRAASDRVVGPLWVGTASSRGTEAVVGAARPPSRNPGSAVPSSAAVRASVGGRTERRLGAEYREYAHWRRPAPHAALPTPTPSRSSAAEGRQRQLG